MEQKGERTRPFVSLLQGLGKGRALLYPSSQSVQAAGDFSLLSLEYLRKETQHAGTLC